MRTPLLIRVLATTALLGGCAVSDIDGDPQAVQPTNRGLLVGSISYEGRYSGYSVHYRGANGEEQRIQIGQGGMIPLSTTQSNFTDKRATGRAFAVPLAPGDYEFYQWTVQSGAWRLASTAPFSVRFTVKPGEAVYIGNFAFLQTDGRGLSVTGARLDYRENAARDLPLLRKMFPILAEAQLTMTVPNGTDIVGLGGASQSTFTIPLPVPYKR